LCHFQQFRLRFQKNLSVSGQAKMRHKMFFYENHLLHSGAIKISFYCVVFSHFMTYLFRMKTFYARLKTHLNKSHVNYKRVVEIGRIIQFFTVSRRAFEVFLLFNRQLSVMNGLLFAVSDLFANNIVLFEINILIVVFVYYLRSF